MAKANHDLRASLITAPAGRRLARQLTRAAARGVAGPTGSANSRDGSASSPAQASASRDGRSVLSPPRRTPPAIRPLLNLLSGQDWTTEPLVPGHGILWWVWITFTCSPESSSRIPAGRPRRCTPSSARPARHHTTACFCL